MLEVRVLIAIVDFLILNFLSIEAFLLLIEGFNYF